MILIKLQYIWFHHTNPMTEAKNSKEKSTGERITPEEFKERERNVNSFHAYMS